MDRLKGGTKFQPGRSGNPGGRVAIAKILDAFGKTTHEMRVELVGKAIGWMNDENESDKTRTYAHKFISDLVGLHAKQTLEVTGVDPSMAAVVAAAGMTPYERRKVLTEADTDTDDAIDVTPDDSSDDSSDDSADDDAD